jgi:predicted type IV restriction endonuclease
MAIPPKVLNLIERFELHLDDYRSGRYNETQARHEFIDPFFMALGWDVNNEQGYAEPYKDVIHEDAIRIGAATKAPDYCFRIGGARKFFVEAKRPGVNLRDDPLPAYQLRRYAWSAKLPLSVLTDFDEFAVYDCRMRPSNADKASAARVMYVQYAEYAERWDEIAAVFSREAVLKGSFDRYAEGTRARKGTAEVDDAFLKEIESWRDVLAHNIALRNPTLSQRELNYAVQMAIDRIIFLRIAEDRGLEPYGRLLALLSGGQAYGRLLELFRQADERYNSGLFYFRPEPGRPETPDQLSMNLALDDKVLQDILRGLYYPDSPYEFSVLPIDILGQVYEQFLGKVIRLTAGHHAVVEDKPEVKKAGGVYYTPTYIVDYIVRQTVGKLCEGKTPRQVANLRILDCACGSGSFLLGAYQYLLDWHRDRYVADGSEKHIRGRAPALYEHGAGDWRLTTAERKRILLNNIYGVDIDRQAVEVTKLSLLLKVLEGETEQTLSPQLRLFQDRALPDLGRNVKCGNSLIGPDYYRGRQASFLEDEEAYRVNPFDWGAEFPEIMAAGGFDCVIGNPPYIRIQTMKEWAPLEVDLYKKLYAAAGQGNYDIYVVFVEKGLSLLNERGRLGFILPHKFFNARYGRPLRELVARGQHLAQVVHFGDQQVFHGATTYTCLLFLDKAGREEIAFEKVDDLGAWRAGTPGITGTILAAGVTAAEWNLTVGAGAALFERLSRMPVKLGDVADIYVGLQTSADDVFIMDLIEEAPQTLRLRSKSLGTDWVFEKGLLFPLVSGTDVDRYRELPERQYILFPYRVDGGSVELMNLNVIAGDYPRTAAYLLKNKKRLEERERGKFKGRGWHRFGRNQNIGIQGQVKLCVPRLVDRLYAAYDAEGNHFLDNVDVGGIALTAAYQRQGLVYLLSLLNSRLLRWYFPFVSGTFRGGWLSANRQFLSQLPIRPIDFDDPADAARHARMVELVERMLDLHKRLAAARTPDEKSRLERQIAATDKEIDALVYELYGLTEEEIKIVEEATK